MKFLGREITFPSLNTSVSSLEAVASGTAGVFVASAEAIYENPVAALEAILDDPTSAVVNALTGVGAYTAGKLVFNATCKAANSGYTAFQNYRKSKDPLISELEQQQAQSKDQNQDQGQTPRQDGPDSSHLKMN